MNFCVTNGSRWTKAFLPFLLLLGLHFSGIANASSIKFDAAPSWVTKSQLGEIDEKGLSLAKDGIYYILVDRQSNLRNNHYTFYNRTATKIVNRAGLESEAKLEFTFDPNEDEFSIHSVKILRDGKIINKLDPDLFEVFRRETDLNSGETDGHLTVYAQLPGVAVGDIIDYEVSWKTKSTLWPNDFFRNFDVEWSIPIGQIRERILVPEDKPLTIKTLKTEIIPQINTYDGVTEYLWAQSNPVPIKSVETRPNSYIAWGYVSVSTIDTWGKVVSSLIDHYTIPKPLPVSAIAFLESENNNISLEEKITRAIRFVQDDIRYVADEEGIGSHVPRLPAIILERKWGDCKDKSLLLVSMLRNLGVESHVALTHNSNGINIARKAPSPFAFNHAIVVISYNGKRYWIDATDSNQGGIFPNIAQPIFDYALPLFSGSDNLWPVIINPANEPEFVIKEIYDFADLDNAGMALSVKTTYTARKADSFRQTIIASQDGELSQQYSDYYQKKYPGLNSGVHFEIDDDRVKNTIIVSEKYYLSKEDFYRDDLHLDFELFSDAVENVLSDVKIADRTAPIWLPFPINQKHVLIVKNTGFNLSGIDDASIDTKEFKFSRKSKSKNDYLEIIYQLQTLKNAVPTEEISNYKILTDTISEWSVIKYNFSTETSYSQSEIALFIAIGILTIGFPIMFWGVQNALKSDDDLPTNILFYPVNLGKFILLNSLTFSIYGLFWMFRCWRWVKQNDQRKISPAVRAFFSIIFFLPLYSRVSDEFSDEKKPKTALGVFLFCGFLIWSVATSVISNAVEDTDILLALFINILEGLSFIWFIPLVIFVNQLNESNKKIINNSSISTRTILLALYGISFWVMIIATILS